MMHIRDASALDIDHVVTNMRAESASEAFASMAHDDRALLAADVREFAKRCAVLALCRELEPAALLATAVVAPGRASLLFLATDAFPSIGAEVHRWWLKHCVPGVLAQFRRVEFIGSLPATPSGEWLKHCGFTCEGIARSHGKNGEDFGHWAWVNPQWRPTVDAAGGRLSSAQGSTGAQGTHV